MQCPKCGIDFEALADAKPVPPTEVPPPPGPPPYEGAYTSGGVSAPRANAGMAMYCIDCGARFPRSEDACPVCGLLVDEMLDERARRPPRPRWLPPMRTHLPIMAAVLFPLGLILFLGVPIVYEMRLGPRSMRDVFAVFFCVTAGAVELAGFVCAITWLYQAWRLLAREDEDYSPGLKIGLLFVPFFNLYWMFVVVPGLSIALQRELRQHAPGRPHNTGWAVGLVGCILMLIPYLQPVALCIFVAWMLIANNAIQRLIRYNERLLDDEAMDPVP